jgi:serine/threonine protein kinase
VLKDVTKALDKVHKAGYVYEDLKPANICSSRASGSLAYKLIDSGSCVMVQPSGMTVPQDVGGTTAYMAPEVEQKLAHTFNADTWSLGESNWSGMNPFAVYTAISLLTGEILGLLRIYQMSARIQPHMNDCIHQSHMNDCIVPAQF